MRTVPTGAATVSGPDLDLLMRDGIGAATSRAITAAEAYGRHGANASYYVRDEAGDVRVRVDVAERCTTVWTTPTEEPRTARALTVPPVAAPSSPRRPEPVRSQPEEEEPLMAARKTKTTTTKTATRASRPGSAKKTKSTATTAKRSATTAKATKTKMSAKDAARAVLANAGGPLTTAQIVEGVLATEGVTLGGKTPAATIAAILSVENAKPDGLFERVAKGTYALRVPAASDDGEVAA